MKTNNRLRPGFLYLLLVLVQFFDVVQARSPLKEAGADFVFINAEIYTMDAARTWQEAIAVDKGKIVYVGSNKGATAFQKVGTRLIDLGSSGKMILPGLHDSHVHLADGGVHLRECNLDQCKSGEQVLKVVKDYAEAHPDLKWVRGSGWSLPLFASGDPKKEALDAIISDRPVYLESQDYHSGWVNSKALEVSGITKKTLDPEGGRIERDAATGEPTGTLRESAMHIVEKLLPARCEKEYIDGLRGAQTLANSFGITSIQDAWASIDLLKAYHGLDKKGELTVKVTAAWKIDPEKEDRVQVEKIKELRQAYLSPRLRLTSAKIFADGVIEAQTAALLAPYLGSSKVECGALNLKPERFDRLVKELEREGFQVHVHAIGDKGIRTSLDAFAHSGSYKNKVASLRHHIAHLELIDEADLERFAKLAVTATIQPFWAQRDQYIEELTEPVLGKARSRNLYPFGSLCRAGARLAGGSDWPVSSLNPFEAIEVALRRVPVGSKNQDAWLPEQRLDLKTCLEAYTINGAFIQNQEDKTGSLEVGKAADLIVLDRNLFNIEPDSIHATRVLMTMLDGKIVFSDKSLDKKSD